MIEYKTPSSAAFLSRKQFYTMQKLDSENIASWLRRLQNIIELCDFEELNDFMFIDKFISGLSEFEFKIVSSFATWTVEKLILMTNDDIQPTENILVSPNPDGNEILSVYIKTETVDIDDIYVPNSNDDLQFDGLKIKTDDPNERTNEVNEFKSVQRRKPGRPKGEKKCMTSSERNRKFIEKLKQSGQYEEYKRRNNERERNKRNSPMMIERRRKNRERYQNKQKLPNATTKSRAYECYLCLANFEKSNELKVHLTIEHQQAKRPVLQCSHCPKTTSSREILAQHVNKFHSDDSVNGNSSQKLHKCPCCDSEFTWLGQLNEHLLTHPDYRPFICETCASSFASLKNLQSHLRKHYKEKPFKCDQCDMKFTWNSSFRDHMLMHRGEKPYPCKICKKSFRQMSQLKRHLIGVHNPEAKPYVCSTCSKSYTTPWHLKSHELNHTGDRPYRCDQCDRAFTQNSSLKTHLKIHEAKARKDQESIDVSVVK